MISHGHSDNTAKIAGKPVESVCCTSTTSSESKEGSCRPAGGKLKLLDHKIRYSHPLNPHRYVQIPTSCTTPGPRAILEDARQPLVATEVESKLREGSYWVSMASINSHWSTTNISRSVHWHTGKMQTGRSSQNTTNITLRNHAQQYLQRCSSQKASAIKSSRLLAGQLHTGHKVMWFLVHCSAAAFPEPSSRGCSADCFHGPQLNNPRLIIGASVDRTKKAIHQEPHWTNPKSTHRPFWTSSISRGQRTHSTARVLNKSALSYGWQPRRPMFAERLAQEEVKSAGV